MSLSNTYKEYIVEQLMFRYLSDGVIPTEDKIEEDLVEYMKTHTDLSLPLSKYKDFSVERGGSSSASLIHDISTVFSQDIGVITKEIYHLVDKSSSFYDRWSTEARFLSSKAKNLEHRVDSLLLLNQDTSGFFSYVGDIFTDMNKIDIKSTSTKVDCYNHTVTLSSVRNASTDASRGAQIDLSDLTEQNISFSILSSNPGTFYEVISDENALSNIFKMDNSTWEGVVSSSTSADIVVELKVNLSDAFDLTKVAFDFLAPIGTTRSTISLLSSVDGYTWSLVSSSEATKALSKNIVWVFPKTKTKWLKFVIRKAASDTDNFYYFSSSHLKIFGDVFETKEPNVLISKALQVKDYQDKLVRFSLVALDACSEQHENTGINYYISAGKEDSDVWTDWFSISPSDEEKIVYPKVINIGGVNWKDNQESATKFDSSLSLNQITRVFDEDDYSYKFRTNSFGVVNTVISLGQADDVDPIANSLVVWRNVRSKETYPDVKLVRNKQRGWGYDGGKYYCYFEVFNSDGSVFDFGDKLCVLDGKQVSGVMNIPKGIHKFATDAVNWFDISNNITESTDPVLSEEKLKSMDPLYPYNHKLLIEGFPYPNDFSGGRIYLGTDISAEFYAVKKSVFDLEYNLSDYGYFSVKNVGTDSNPALAVLANFDVSNSDYTNELFVIKWRAGKEDTDLYTQIKLKAELWTKDTSLTPTLQSYRLKLGI